MVKVEHPIFPLKKNAETSDFETFRMNPPGLRRIHTMRYSLIFSAVALVAILSVSCANPRLPESSRIGKRESAGNADLRLPSQWGSRPNERSRWWHGPETRYPNSGYYNSEQR